MAIVNPSIRFCRIRTLRSEETVVNLRPVAAAFASLNGRSSDISRERAAVGPLKWHGARWQDHCGSRGRPSRQPVCLSNGDPVCREGTDAPADSGCTVGNVPIGFRRQSEGHYGQSATSLTTSGERRAAGKHAGHPPEDAARLTIEAVDELHGSCCPRGPNISRDHCLGWHEEALILLQARDRRCNGKSL
jgi:hypothetical protein